MCVCVCVHRDDDEDEERGSTDEQEGSQKPPTYKMTDIAPPAYQDAVQDVLIHQQTDASAQEGEPQEENVEEEKEEIVEVPLDEHEVRVFTKMHLTSH